MSLFSVLRSKLEIALCSTHDKLFLLDSLLVQIAW